MALVHGAKLVTNGLVLDLDAANKKSYSQNEFQYSTDIFSWNNGTIANAATISRDTISSPVGNKPLKMEITGNDPYTNSYNSSIWNIAPASSGQTWVVSVYVKANVATTGEIFIFGSGADGNVFDATNGQISAGAVNIGTEWTRVSYSFTFTKAISFIQLRLDGTPLSGSGQTIWWDGIQVERVPSGTSSPTPFTSSYYGGTVYKSLVDNNNNNGTLVNGVLYNSGNQGSLSFDGVDDYISIPDSNSLQFGDNFTISSWIYPTDLSARFGIFSTRFNNSSGSWQLEVGVANSGTSRIAVTGVGTWIWESNSNVIQTNTWSNICYISSINTLYLNGLLLTPLVTTAYTILNNASIKVLASGTSGTQFFPGKISQVSIYNRAISEAEVQQNFNALRGRYGI